MTEDQQIRLVHDSRMWQLAAQFFMDQLKNRKERCVARAVALSKTTDPSAASLTGALASVAELDDLIREIERALLKSNQINKELS